MTHINEAEWVQYYGFRRFPFDRLEASNEEFAEPGFLSSCFVEPRSFARILGQADAPVSALLFAARGTGKTACRVMIDYYCQNGQVNTERRRVLERPSLVLSIPHVHLHRVLSAAKERAPGLRMPNISAEDHALEILKRAMPALADALAKTPELSSEMKRLSREDHADLSWLMLTYSSYLTSAQAGFLAGLGVDTDIPERVPIGFLADQKTSTRSRDWFSVLAEKRLEASSLDHLAQWAKLMRHLGFLATYVLVDGIDEFEESADNPTVGFEIIRPLLACLRLMDETPHLALKFFLPSDVKPLVDADNTIRRDRGFVAEAIVWTNEDLTQILRRRLNVLRTDIASEKDRTDAGFDALCAPELRGEIERNLAEVAGGNPRRLLVLCGLMVTAHCARNVSDQDDPYQLDRQDFVTALDQQQSHISRLGASPDPSTTMNIQALIMEGENERLEFKASLHWDYKTQSVNRGLRYVIAKAIAGLMNAFGGGLLIGVADDGAVVGIEKDLQTLTKPTLDKFRLALTDVVKTYLGVDYMSLVGMRFEIIDQKWVCLTSVEQSPQPVFLATGDTHEFWVRLGNSTRNLDVMNANRYIRTHWAKDV